MLNTTGIRPPKKCLGRESLPHPVPRDTQASSQLSAVASTPADGSLHRRKTTFFFFSPSLLLLAVIGFRLKQPRPHQERRALGRGRRRGCGRREGPKERAEGFQPSSPTKQKKDQKTEKRRANRHFQEQSPHLQADCALGIQIPCLPKTKAPKESGGATPGRGPHRGARTARRPDAADHVSRPSTLPQLPAPPAHARHRARLPRLGPRQQLQPRSK